MFKIPDDLSQFSVAGIRDLRQVAATKLAEYRSTVTDPETVADETLAEMETLKSFVTAADAEIKAREERAAKFTEFTTVAEVPMVDEPAVEAKTETEVEETATETDAGTTVTDVDVSDVAGAAVTAASVAPDGTKGAKRSVQIKDVARVAPTQPVPQTNSDNFEIYAAADVPGYPAGKALEWSELGEVFEARARGYGATSNGRRAGARAGRQQHGMALIQRQMPEFQQILENDGEVELYRKLQKVAETSKSIAKEVNARTAAVGWCAPSETNYSICNPVTAEGLLDLPEVLARRGDIRHNRGIDWVTFFGGSYPALDTNVPGMTILTEAQVEADTAKTCLEIDCPPFVDERLNVAALCLTGSLLQNRGYPEYVTEFTRGAMAAFAHFVNREIIDIIEDGSTAVTIAANDAAAATPALSTLMNAVELAVTDMRYRLRLSLNAPIDIILPYWIRPLLRADYIRRNAAANNDIADSEIASMFAMRGANVQYVMDWQDAFSGVAGGFGATTALTAYPNATVRFLAFPPGTWIIGRQDVIRLDTVYDSVNLQQNLVTQLFLEDGWLPMRMCPLSRVYTVSVCPSGITASQATIENCAA